MARSAALLVCGLGAALGACSPFGGGAFECSLDTQCGAGGRCSSGYCSFPDGDCPSGFRYGELSGPSSGQCVGGDMQVTDASMQTDDMMMAPDSMDGVCYGTGLVRACFATAPTGNTAISANVDTDTSTLCDDDPRNAAWCVIAGESVAIATTIRVTGSRPLVLVATSSIAVQGTLDVASHRSSGQVGPAANPSACDNGTAPGTSGGGAGGSFGGSGGKGGGGQSDANTGGAAGNATAAPTTLRGGCRGQDGNGTNEGAGGNGGGAVYLIAETSINVTGTLDASGAGATSGALNASGGGGGGSGGFIGLDAPTVLNAGNIVANGGGGGEGSGTSTAGDPGDDPANPTTPAPGGAGLSTSGGDGGDGAAGTTLTGENGTTGTNGGGGAGGGAGIIRLDRASSISGGGSISPPAT